jgi:hypothetical protein
MTRQHRTLLDDLGCGRGLSTKEFHNFETPTFERTRQNANVGISKWPICAIWLGSNVWNRLRTFSISLELCIRRGVLLTIVSKQTHLYNSKHNLNNSLSIFNRGS